MPCATRGPAHKLCRSLLIARTRKGIHSYAPLPRFPMHTATHRTPLPPNLKGQEGNALAPPPLPILQRIAKLCRSLPISRDQEGNTLANADRCAAGGRLHWSSEAEKASAKLHCLAQF